MGVRVRVVLASVFVSLVVHLRDADAQENAGDKPAGSNVSDAELQKRIDEAVERKLKELSKGSAQTTGAPSTDAPPTGTPSQATDGSIGAQIEKMMNQKMPFELHGSIYLWYYQPFIDGAKPNTEIYYANLTLDGKDGDFGYHFEPRFRDTKLRPYYSSNVWIQEAYGSWTTPDDLGTLKAGKEYTHFGHFWDDTFFGNQPYFDGLKLNPEVGVSLENVRKVDDRWALEYAVQFFPNDGSTNGSLQDRDTISVAGARRRNDAILRVAPKIALDKDVSLQVGGSAERFTSDFAAPNTNDTVYRYAGDVELAVGAFDVFTEVIQQKGTSVLDFPLAGTPSDNVKYWWSGIGYHVTQDLLVRCAFSTADYGGTGVRETTWLPGVTWSFNKHAALLVEYDAWRRSQPGDDTSLDRSINFILYFHF